jgi:hypothetical protein
VSGRADVRLDEHGVPADVFAPSPELARLLFSGVCLGAFTLGLAVLLLLRKAGRSFGVVIGAAGIAGGSVAALVYTLYYFSLGIDIDAVPEGYSADWFVAGFGAAGGILGIAIVLSPRLRQYLRRSWRPGDHDQ